MIDNGAENDGGRARNGDVKKDHISIHKLADDDFIAAAARWHE